MTAQKTHKAIKRVAELLRIYYEFNTGVFRGELPEDGFTFTETTSTKSFGHFKPYGLTGENGEPLHDICLNLSYFNAPLVEGLPVFVHQLAHMYQHLYGKKRPSRMTYHNDEFKEIMKGIGVEYSDDRNWTDFVSINPESQMIVDVTGHHLIHENGNFASLVKRKKDSLMITIKPLQSPTAQEGSNKNKATYVCPDCGSKKWGKSGDTVVCGCSPIIKQLIQTGAFKPMIEAKS
jgi:hypothetical protein